MSARDWRDGLSDADRDPLRDDAAANDADYEEGKHE